MLGNQLMLAEVATAAAAKCIKCDLLALCYYVGMPYNHIENHLSIENAEKETLIECDCRINRLVYVKNKRIH